MSVRPVLPAPPRIAGAADGSLYQTVGGVLTPITRADGSAAHDGDSVVWSDADGKYVAEPAVGIQPPRLSVEFDGSGNATIDSRGDSLTATHRIAYSNVSYPSDATTRAAPVQTGQDVSTTGGTVADGGTLFVAAFAYDASGNESLKSIGAFARGGGGGGATTPITSTDETATIPGSRQLVDGTGTTIDTSTPGQVKVNVSGGGGGGGGGADSAITVLAPKPGDPLIVTAPGAGPLELSSELRFGRNSGNDNFARIQAYVAQAIATGATMRLQYTLNGIAWNDAGSLLGIDTTGWQPGLWAALAADAKAPMRYRLAVQGGDGSLDLHLGLTIVEFSESATAPGDIGGGESGAVLPYTTHLEAYYRSDLGVTLDASNNASNLVDQSLGGHDLYNEIASNYPAYVENALGSIPALRWVGSSNQKRLHSNRDCLLTADFTLFSVFRPTDLSTGGRRLFSVGGAAPSTDWRGVSLNSSGNTAGRVGGLLPGVAWLDTTSSYVLNAVVAVMVVRVAGVITIYRNNVALSPTFSATPNGVGANQFVLLGYPNDNNGFVGDWFESGYFTEGLTGAAFDDVWGYLLARYGL